MLLFGENIKKTGPADPEIIVVRVIIKKIKKEKPKETRNAWQSLAYSPLSAVVSPPSEYLWKHTDHLSGKQLHLTVVTIIDSACTISFA